MSRGAKSWTPLQQGTDRSTIPAIFPPPVVRVFGASRGSPQEAEVIAAHSGLIGQYHAKMRMQFYGGIVPVQRIQRDFDSCRLVYENYNHQEVLTIIPRITGAPTSPKLPVRWLILEFLYEATRDGVDVPRVYPYAGINWARAGVNVQGTGVGAVILGTELSSTGEFNFPTLPGLLGKADNFQVFWASSSDATKYGFPGATSSSPPEMIFLMAGTFVSEDPSALSGFQFSDPQFTSEPWAPAHPRRHKGFRETNVHELYPRVQFVNGALDGQAVGVNPDLGTWDDLQYTIPHNAVDPLPLIQLDGNSELGNNYTTKTRQIRGDRISQYVLIDLDRYWKDYDKVAFKLRISGFWRSARNTSYVHNAGPSEGFTPREWFSSQAEWTAWQLANYPNYEGPAWDDFMDTMDPTTPAPVELRGTVLSYPNNEGDDLLDIYDYMNGSLSPKPGIERFQRLNTLTLAATQTSPRGPTPPTVLPYGEIFGTLYVNFTDADTAMQFKRNE